MFEGKNIHLSPVDGKRLCSFSRKLCKQRRLNGYGFCIRHILEDCHAPFKQCEFTIKSNSEKCFNPVPKSATRIYCNNHLQVLGLLPKHCNKKKPVSKKPITKPRKEVKPDKMKKKSENAASTTKEKRKRKKGRSAKDICNAENIRVDNWQSSMVKMMKTSGQCCEQWKQKTLNTTVSAFRDTRQTAATDENVLDYYVVKDECAEFSKSEAYQSVILASPERVHHNTLRADSISFQERKILCKLKHQYGQLKQVVKAKQESGLLSYAVLSKLAASARCDPLQTANVLNTSNNGTFSSKIFRPRRHQAVYKVPCCLVVGNTRCPNAALPYMKYCSDHCTEDWDQLLFSKAVKHRAKKTSSACTTILSFLQDEETSQIHWKRKGDVVTHCKNKQRKQSVNTKQTSINKKTRLKRTMKKSSSSVSLKAQMQKKFSIPHKPVQKLNAHVNSTLRKSVDDENKVLDVVNDSTTLSEDAETTEDSSSEEEDSGSDTLTPEEAFHLPPGSLSSFSTPVDDEDSFSNIRRNCEVEDDDEFIRCSNSFEPFEPGSQLGRDLTSPTLNQLSSTDFDAFNMLLSPTKSLNPTAIISPRSSTLMAAFSSVSTMTSVNAMHKSLLARQKSDAHDRATTSLKITPVNVGNTSRKICFNAGCTAKHDNSSSSLSVNIPDTHYQDKRLYKHPTVFTNGKHTKPPSHGHTGVVLTNGIATHHNNSQALITLDENVLSKRYLNDSLLTQPPFFTDTSLFDDIRTDVDSPLEKVNPDIFFSSVFPVAHSAANI